MNTRTTVVICATLVGVTFLSLGVWVSSQRSTAPPVRAEPAANDERPKQTVKATVPAYRVISDRLVYDDAMYSKVRTDVFIEEHVTEKKLRDLLDHLYKLAMQRGPFKYREHPNSVFVFIFAREGQNEIAMGHLDDSGFVIRIDSSLLKTVNDPPVVRFGFTESKRQMIFRDIVRVERRAVDEAEQLYPWPMSKDDPTYTETGEKNQLQKQGVYADELMEEYRAELAASLGLTVGELKEIGNEGVLSHWIFPPLRKADQP